MKMKLKSKRIRSMKEIAELPDMGVVGKSLLAAGWRPTKKQIRERKKLGFN
jgi:hypothetical protein